MKTSWIIFIVFAYLGIFYFASIPEYRNLLNSTVIANVQSLGQPSGTNWLLQSVSQITEVWNYIKTLIQMIFLWNGTVWVGSWLYFYVFACLPIVGGMVASLVFILRGVHSS